MTDEEKKAIEIVKEIKDIRGMRQDVDGENEDLWSLDIVINLIEKQSKEIEKLKENNGYHLGFIDGGIAKRYEYEDKIKAKIEELRKLDFGTNLVSQFTANSTTITILQSLLEKE